MTKKSIIFIVSIIIFLFIIITNVNAYRKICLRNGEKYPGTNKICHLSSGEGYCGPVCVADDLSYTTNPNRCLSIEGPCEYLNEQAQDQLTLSVGINDFSSFSIKSLSLNIQTNKKAKIEYKDNNVPEKWIVLCSYCDFHNKKRSFKEGLNNITIRASRNGQVVEKTVVFFVDSKKPRITKLLPTNNAYGNGEFIINYDEDYLKQISLYINNVLIQTKLDCPSGKKQTCTFNADLIPYDNQQIEFYFVVEDAINVIKSKSNKIKVDLTNPILTVNSPLNQDYSAGKILFDMTADDKYTLQYSVNGDKFKTLCANCNKYKNYKTFGTGSYNLILQALDKAGNIDQEIINFNVV